MRFVIQRVKEASVTVEQEMIGKIGHGLLVFVGVSDTDDKQIADKMIDKLTKLRIFDDEEGKTNLAAADVNGEFLIISQFTLYADCRKGNRPSFVKAGKPATIAVRLYRYHPYIINYMSMLFLKLARKAFTQSMAPLVPI